MTAALVPQLETVPVLVLRLFVPAAQQAVPPTRKDQPPRLTLDLLGSQQYVGRFNNLNME